MGKGLKSSTKKRVKRQPRQQQVQMIPYQAPAPVQSTPIADAGQTLGRMLGGLLGKWTGTGAYRSKILRPVRARGRGAYTLDTEGMVRPNAPLFSSSTAEEGVCISHREYLGDIISSATPGAFKVSTFDLSPSNGNSFPWLSNIAQPNFQQYSFDSLIFEYKSFSSNSLNSTNTALGGVFSCVNYDISDAPFNSRMQIENTQWAQCNKPSESFIIPVECAPGVTANRGLFYINNGGNLPANADPKQYYLGRLSVATQGFQGASVNCGSLYVNYKVRLLKPFQTFPLTNALVANFNRTSCDMTNRLGTTTTTNIHMCDNIGVVFGGNTITIDKRYLQVGMQLYVVLGWSGASTASVVAPNWSISAGSVGANYFNDNVGFNIPFAAATTDRCGTMQCINVQDVTNNIVITLSAGQLPTAGAVNCNVQIMQVNGMLWGNIGVTNEKASS